MNTKINSVNNTIQYQQQLVSSPNQHHHHNQHQSEHKLQTQDRSCQLLLSTTTNQNNHINDKNSEQMSSPLPVIRPSELLFNPTPNNERSLVAVYCFVKNFIG